MRPRNRVQAYRRGRRGELMARWLLRLKGYRIVASGLRSTVGEIDILARRGRLLAAVEVKRRDTLAGAIESITPRQRARIARAVQLYLASRPDLAGCDVRFDVVLVSAGVLPRHLADAWQAA